MLDRGFVDGIADLAREVKVIVDDRAYSTVPLIPVIEPVASAVKFRSLTGFAGYILTGPDSLFAPVVVHVESPTLVRILGPVEGEFRVRESLALAVPHPCSFEFGRYYDQERFIIAMQSLFVQTAMRDEVIRLASVITGDEIRTQTDDGITQEVVVKSGQTLKSRVELPSPVPLRPFRTFREVEQPESAFLLRAKKGSNGAELALFEADGGAWELVAMETVAGYLRTALLSVQVLA
jgi:hypothetical protein